jgi:TonB family protein
VPLLWANMAVGTWGLFRPRIVLPAEALDWDDARARAVLAHELAHVRRGDWAVQLAADTLRAVFWFNPFSWMVARRLRDESERACDDVVLHTGMPDAAYATHLLDIARASRGAAPAAAMAMARSSTLEGRITAMLNPTIDRRSPSRRARLATAVLLLLVACAAAVRVAAQVAGPATLEGSVYDSSGAVLPGVELALENEQGVKWTTPTDGTGHFEFAPVGAGKYVLEVVIPGFKTLRQNIVLEREKDWKKVITMQVGELEETIQVTARRPQQPTPPPAPSTSAGVVRVGGNIKMPAKTRNAQPVYPPAMQAAGLEGVVKLDVLIGTDGHVVSVRVLSSQVHPDFAASAAAAVKQWEFTPTLLNGRAVEVAMTVSMSFSLSD